MFAKTHKYILPVYMQLLLTGSLNQVTATWNYTMKKATLHILTDPSFSA